jgi:shikimate kinase
LRVGLVGVNCVGTTTIGRILADRRGWPFFDLDEEIERHFGISIARLQARFLTGYSYRKDCAVVLERIATANPDCVIAERTGTRVGTRGCRGCAGRRVPPGSGGGAAAGRRGYALLMSSADPSGGQGTV